MAIFRGHKVLQNFLTDALGIEEWKQEVKKVEEHVRAVEKKFIDRCKELEVGMCRCSE